MGRRKLVDGALSALTLMFGASVPQNIFPVWESGRDARPVMFQLGRPTGVGNGTRLRPVSTADPSLWSERFGLLKVTNMLMQ